MNGAYIPAIITASVALIAATAAQFLSHLFHAKRERKNRENDIYQEFIYPFIPEVLLYYDTSTYRKGHDIETEVVLENLLERISQKVSYGNMKLLLYSYETKKWDYLFDGRGWSKNRNMLKFIFWYLDYSVEILKNKKPVEETLLSEIIQVQKYYGIWALVSEEIDYDLSVRFMSSDYLFQKVVENIEMKGLRHLVDSNEIVNVQRAHVLKKVIMELQEQKETANIHGLNELKAVIDSKYHSS